MRASNQPSVNFSPILLAALLRPRQLAQLVQDAPHGQRFAVLFLVELCVALCGLLMVLGFFLILPTTAIIVSIVYTTLMAIIGAAPIYASLPLSYGIRARLLVSAARSLAAIGPLALVGFALIHSPGLVYLQSDPMVVLLFLGLLGMWLGGSLTAAISVSRWYTEPTVLRWIIIIGTLVCAALLWWSRSVQQGDLLLLVPFLVGSALGVLRLLSYVWEAALCLLLALLAQLGMAPQRLIALHPAAFDELCLLPLPGLASLLVRACQEGIDTGGPWLVRVAQYRSQSLAARHALNRLVQGDLAHPMLLWLSVNEQGAAWLQLLLHTAPQLHSLIAAYCALTLVPEPAAWPATIQLHIQTIARAAPKPGGMALQLLLQTGLAVLQATRWQEAMLQLQQSAALEGVASDPLLDALVAIHRLACVEVDQCSEILSALRETDAFLVGWPAALLNTMIEQLEYLYQVEANDYHYSLSVNEKS